jgi:hypothetical protein
MFRKPRASMSLNARAGEEEQKGGDRRRIIEIPKDLEQFEFRDAYSKFIA